MLSSFFHLDSYTEWTKDEVDGQDKEREREKIGLVSSQITRHSERTVEGSPRVMVTAVVDRVSPTRPDIYKLWMLWRDRAE